MCETNPPSLHVIPSQNPVRASAGQLVSVIMANLDGQAYLRDAVRSVLNQTYQNLELIISDDGSSDASCSIIREEMADDPRIKLLEAATSKGPAGARNRALAAASGYWIAIVDSDDVIHPERLARLIRSAVTLESDLVADDIIFFGHDPLERNKTLLQDLHLEGPQNIDAVALVTGCLNGKEKASFGYLKPLIRRAALGDIRFNEDLQIDEDYDLYLRLLLSGATFALIPEAMYLYRRHAASVSYRFSAGKLRLMIAAQEDLQRQLLQDNKDLVRAVGQRLQQTREQLEYLRIVEALNAGSKLSAVASLLRNPNSALRLIRSLQERMMRRWRRERDVRKPVKIVLSARGHAKASDFPDATIVYVPEVSDTGWSPSAAGTWACLADLSCAHDLDIIALDRAGIYALGLVPRWTSARVQRSCHGAPITGSDHFHPVSSREGI